MRWRASPGGMKKQCREIYVKGRDYSKNTGLLQAARASCKVWRVW